MGEMHTKPMSWEELTEGNRFKFLLKSLDNAMLFSFFKTI